MEDKQILLDNISKVHTTEMELIMAIEVAWSFLANAVKV